MAKEDDHRGEQEAVPNGKPQPDRVRFDYLKSGLFRIIHADGVVGGLTPRLDCTRHRRPAASRRAAGGHGIMLLAPPPPEGAAAPNPALLPPRPESDEPPAVEQRFPELVRQWKEATRFLSSIHDMSSHPAY